MSEKCIKYSTELTLKNAYVKNKNKQKKNLWEKWTLKSIRSTCSEFFRQVKKFFIYWYRCILKYSTQNYFKMNPLIVSKRSKKRLVLLSNSHESKTIIIIIFSFTHLFLYMYTFIIPKVNYVTWRSVQVVIWFTVSCSHHWSLV